MITKELAQQALGALESAFTPRSAYISDEAHTKAWEQHEAAITALRAAIAQGDKPTDMNRYTQATLAGHASGLAEGLAMAKDAQPESEPSELSDGEIYRRVSKRVAEVNTSLILKPMPFAWLRDLDVEPVSAALKRANPQFYEHYTIALFLEEPVGYVPPSDEQIDALVPAGDAWKYEVGFDEARHFARAVIERAVRGGK